MKLNRSAATAAALGWMLTATPGMGAELILVHETFNDFVLAGCVSSILESEPIQNYAESKGLQPARPQLAAALLQSNSGEAYVKSGGEVLVVIGQLPDGTCIVAARSSPDLDVLIKGFEDVILGDGMPFQRAKSSKPQKTASGGTTTTRAYTGMIESTAFVLTLKTTPGGRDVIAQAVATVAVR